MPSGLGICFSPQDAECNAAFAAALGVGLSLFCFEAAPPSAHGANSVYVAPLSSKDLVNSIALAGQDIWPNFDFIFAPSSIAGKDIIAYIAGLLNASAVTDVTEVLPDRQFKRPILAGSVIATVQVGPGPILATFRPASFTQRASNEGSPEVIALPPIQKSGGEVLENIEGVRARPDLSQAKVVISGGKPLKDAETFERVIGGLADHLGGAVGATRAAVDLGIAPNDLQVGQTGKVVAPDLYIACGISGATQHIAGIKDSKVIVAINKDKDAPIFDIADFGLVADLFEAIPELEAHLKR